MHQEISDELEPTLSYLLFIYFTLEASTLWFSNLMTIQLYKLLQCVYVKQVDNLKLPPSAKDNTVQFLKPSLPTHENVDNLGRLQNENVGGEGLDRICVPYSSVEAKPLPQGELETKESEDDHNQSEDNLIRQDPNKDDLTIKRTSDNIETVESEDHFKTPETKDDLKSPERQDDLYIYCNKVEGRCLTHQVDLVLSLIHI